MCRLFYATEDPDLRVKGHIVGFKGPWCFFKKIFVQKMIRGALLVSDICSDLLGDLKPRPNAFCIHAVARDVRPE